MPVQTIPRELVAPNVAILSRPRQILALLPGTALLFGIGLAGKALENLCTWLRTAHHIPAPHVEYVLWAIVLVAFSVPFVGLVGRRGKRDPRRLTAVVTAALLGQVLEGVWRIAPAFRPSPLLLGLLLPAALLLGGLGLLAMQWLVTRLPKPEKAGEAHAAAH